MPSTVQPFYVWEMAEPGEWCWSCDGFTAQLVPVLTEADSKPRGVAWARHCVHCGTRSLVR